WQGKRLLTLDGVLLALFRGVESNEHFRGAYGAIEGASFDFDQRSGGLEVHIVGAQLGGADGKVGVEGNSYAELLGDLFVKALGVATQIEITCAGFRFEKRK